MKAIIVPVRSESARFPRKHLQRLGETSVLGVLIERAKLIGDPVWVATTWRQADAEVVAEAINHGARAWRGHPTNLHERYLELCLTEGITSYIEISGDCPFFDMDQAERIWKALDDIGDHDVCGEPAAYAPSDIVVSGKSLGYLTRWVDYIGAVPEDRRDQYWTYGEKPEMKVLELPYEGDRTRTPIKHSIDWPMDLAIANVVLQVLGRYPTGWQDLEQVYAQVRTMEVVGGQV